MQTLSRHNYDTNDSKLDPTSGDRYQCAPLNVPTPRPALRQLARMLGKQAAHYFVENRFKGLGQLELIRLQMEADQARRTCNAAV